MQEKEAAMVYMKARIWLEEQKCCQDRLIFKLGTSQVQVRQITADISITWK